MGNRLNRDTRQDLLAVLFYVHFYFYVSFWTSSLMKGKRESKCKSNGEFVHVGDESPPKKIRNY